MQEYMLTMEAAGGEFIWMYFTAAEITTQDGMLWAWDKEKALVISVSVSRIISFGPHPSRVTDNPTS